MAEFSFKCYGHPYITSKHRSTIEFTTDNNLTSRGDCILGVRSDANLLSLPNDVKNLLRKKNSIVSVSLKLEGYLEVIKGFGHPDLQLNDKEAIVIRKSDYICPKTLMIHADKSAIDISEEIRERMKNPDAEMEVTIQVENGEIDASKQA